MRRNLSSLCRWLPAGVDLRLLCAAAFCCFAVWGFVELADDAPEGDFLELETDFLRSLRQPDALNEPIGPPWIDDAAAEITALGGIPVLILLIILVCGYLLLLRRFRSALFVLAATSSGTLITFALKSFFGRERPDFIPQLADVSTSSFPSGHAMISPIVYLTLGTLLARTAHHNREKIYFISIALLLSFIIGLTRIYLGVHYPTDVLAGWAGGTAWALFCWAIAYWLQKRGNLKDEQQPRKPRP